MPNQHKTPLLGWHPTSAEDAAWLRAEAERRGGKATGALARLLDKALADLRAKMEGGHPVWCRGCGAFWTEPPDPRPYGPDPEDDSCACTCSDENAPHYEDWYPVLLPC